ncbi:hypothetical protein ACFLZW_07710 [Chloroflexota bacterium]
MEIILGIIAAVVVICALIAFEYRIRQPDDLVLYEAKGRIGFREGLLYPRHFSLHFKRTTSPIQLNIDVTAAGNLGANVKLVGSVAPSRKNIQSLIRIGGWNTDALARAAEEAQVLLEGMVKEYTERSEIHALSSTSILNYLYEQSPQIEQKLGVELITLVVQSLEPTDPQVADALRQREKARLLEETEQLNQKARSLAAQAKYQTDEEIVRLDHTLALKKIELNKILLEKEAGLAQQRLDDELERNRKRLAFEKEEVEMLKGSPELLMLTPQAARLAEASQSLKSARTVISFTPQELAQGSDILSLFKSLLQKALDAETKT